MTEPANRAPGRSADTSPRLDEVDAAPAGPMTAERWRSIDAVVQAALERQPADRSAFVAARCGGDMALRRDVDALLAGMRDDDFLERPAADVAAPRGALVGADTAASRGAGREPDGDAERMAALVAAALRGRYAVERELGRGGMAIVYLARDQRHGRAVAVKVLLPELAAELGAERFLREIALTASLQHPHVLPLHDSGDADGLLYYVMPYVAGESLRARLTRERQLPVDDAVRIATEIAGALVHAHRRGVVHRDVKPENVLLDADGHALVADFGIARAVEQAAGTSTLTRPGVSPGTPHYMSPEQVSAERAVDGRSDVWALGCVLYEMLAGQPPFVAATVPGILARVLADDPPPLATLRRSVPPHVAVAVHRALEKTVADRFATAAHFVAALEAGTVAPSAAPRTATTPTERRWPRAVRLTRRETALAVFAVAALGAAAWGWLRPREGLAPDVAPMRFLLELPESRQTGDVQPLALSPDGQLLAFLGGSVTRPQIHLRRIGELQSRPLAGTEGAHAPAFSPDGQWIAFLVEDKLRKVRVTGGQPVGVTDLPGLPDPPSSTMSWGDGDVIVFSTYLPGTLWAVSADGGRPRELTQHRPGARRAAGHRHPHVLPGGRAVLFTEISPENRGSVSVVDLRTGRVTRLVDDGERAVYVQGRMVFTQYDGSRLAVPFDHGRAVPTGRPVPIDIGLRYVASAAGTFAFGGRPAWPQALVLVGRDGAERPLPIMDSLQGWAPRYAPDGGRIAFTTDASTPSPQALDRWLPDLWVQRLDSSPPLRLSARRGEFPTFSPDGRRVVFSAHSSADDWDLYSQPADGSAAPEVLLARPHSQRDASWGPDGSWLVFRERVDAKPNDLMLLDLRGGGTVRPVVQSPADEMMPAVSPDGRWLAYASDASGRFEVYVRALSGAGPWQISSRGGTAPRWSPDGARLYFWHGDEFMEAVVRGAGGFELGAVRMLFRGPNYRQWQLATNYDVHPDGESFLMVRAAPADRVVIVLNALGQTR